MFRLTAAGFRQRIQAIISGTLLKPKHSAFVSRDYGIVRRLAVELCIYYAFSFERTSVDAQKSPCLSPAVYVCMYVCMLLWHVKSTWLLVIINSVHRPSCMCLCVCFLWILLSEIVILFIWVPLFSVCTLWKQLYLLHYSYLQDWSRCSQCLS